VSELFEDRLAALRQRFRDRANAESRALETIVLELEAGIPGGARQGEIKRIAHSLAGAGGTFGFSAISACAAELEEFVSDLPDSPELAGACRALILEIDRTVW
jgi:chemotaxis protein histidine kinase CheA